MTAALILKSEDWPELHRRRFEAMFAEGDILDGRGPAYHWAAGSRRKRIQSYGHWLAFLSRTQRLHAGADPARLISPEAAAAFIADTTARISRKSTSMQVADLLVIARRIAPDENWSWLEQLNRRLRNSVGPYQIKPRAGVSARDLFEWSQQHMARWRGEASRRVSAAQRFRDGLSVGLLIARPLRARAFVNLSIGRQLQWTPSGFVLRLDASDMKNRRACEYPMPEQLNTPLAFYTSDVRPVLLRDAQSDRLWISQSGHPMSIDSFTSNLANLTRREFGEALRPHAFRRIAATSIAVEDPEHVAIVAELLGHTTLAMSEKYYNQACGVEAIATYQRLLQSIRPAHELKG